jgi:hypothetical protein
LIRALGAMTRARDVETAQKILALNSQRFPDEVGALRQALLRRISELRNLTATLEQDVWTSMELSCLVEGRKFNPDNKNPRQMPYLVGKYGAAEAVRRTIDRNYDEGTTFFLRAVEAGIVTYTSEAICLRHPDRFDDKTKKEAQARLDRHPTLPR